ncbi:MAG: DUF3368 domain-containing protein [Chloroflexota bacterium]
MSFSSIKPVVSDSSPLILYSRIDRLDILQSLYHRIAVPPAVRNEVTDDVGSRAGSEEVSRASWIHEQNPTNRAQVEALRQKLDRGEAEAIVLAQELSTDSWLLVDDLAARKVALAHKLNIIGSAGILITAKDREPISEVRPILLELVDAGLRASTDLITTIINAAHE